MHIAVDSPEGIAERLQAKWGDLSLAAREAMAIEGYRSGAISQNQVQRLLGLGSRGEVDALLKRAGVYLEYTEEDVAREVEDDERTKEMIVVSDNSLMNYGIQVAGVLSMVGSDFRHRSFVETVSPV
jgi:hypothetical protein